MLPDGEIQRFQVHYLCKNQAIHISWHLLCRSLGVQSVSEKSDSSVIPLSSVGGCWKRLSASQELADLEPHCISANNLCQT